MTDFAWEDERAAKAIIVALMASLDDGVTSVFETGLALGYLHRVTQNDIYLVATDAVKLLLEQMAEDGQ